MINEEIKRLSMLNNMYLIAEKNTKRDVNGFTVIEASDDWRD